MKRIRARVFAAAVLTASAIALVAARDTSFIRYFESAYSAGQALGITERALFSLIMANT